MDPDRLDASLARIARIPFRAKFRLCPPEREYVAFRGMDSSGATRGNSSTHASPRPPPGEGRLADLSADQPRHPQGKRAQRAGAAVRRRPHFPMDRERGPGRPGARQDPPPALF